MLPEFLQPYLEDFEDFASPYLRELEDRDINLTYVGGAAVATIILIQAVRIMLSRFTPPSVASTITVKWNREKLRLPLPAPDSKIESLRLAIAEKTGLEPSAFKLVHSGGVIKDNDATISACGIKKGSKIVVIDGAAHTNGKIVPEQREKKAKPTTEEETKAYIRDEMQRITQSLAPALDVFLKVIESPTPTSSAGSAPPITTASSIPQPTESTTPADKAIISDIDYEHRRLNEEFVQALLRLDELHFDSEWADARTDRKGAVKSVQLLLDRLDKGWRDRTERLAAQ